MAADDNAARNNAIETVLDLASLALSLAELKVAIDSGDKLDVLMAGGTVLIEGIAVAVPFLPGGAGLTLKIVRAGENEKLVAKVFDEAGNEVAVLSKGTEVVKEGATASSHLLDEKALNHIIDGDVTGGGHLYGAGIPGKSEFPQVWTKEKIAETISDIATDPNIIWSSPARNGYISKQFERGLK